MWDAIQLTCISFSRRRRWHAAYYGPTNPLLLGEVTTLQSELALHISARIGIFRKVLHSLKIGAKSNVLALLAYAGREICDCSLAPG